MWIVLGKLAVFHRGLGVAYILGVLCKGALAVGVEEGRGCSNFIPPSKIRLEVETNVGTGVIAATIPEGWDGILCCRGGS